MSKVCFHGRVKVRLYPNYTGDGADADVTCADCGFEFTVVKGD